MAAPLPKRMQLKPGHTVLVVNAPPDYTALLDPLPEGAWLVTDRDLGDVDALHLFVRDQAEVAQHGLMAVAAAEAGATVWIAYPKTSSGLPTDLTRDRGWDVVLDRIDRVSQISIDETWSALRWRPVAEIARRKE